VEINEYALKNIRIERSSRPEESFYIHGTIIVLGNNMAKLTDFLPDSSKQCFIE
jgi:hypothetical protein